MHIYLKLRAIWMPAQYSRLTGYQREFINNPALPIQTTGELDASVVLTGALDASVSLQFHGQVHQIFASYSFYYSYNHVSPQANHIQSRKPSGQTHPFKSYAIHILHSRSISSFMYALQAKHIHSCTFIINSCENIYNHTFFPSKTRNITFK